MSDDPLVAQLQAGRRQFLDLVAEVRPDLHRYCARMTGSVAEGEDVVQEALARAYYALSELERMPALRPWLFQIAHNGAIDHLRRQDRHIAAPLELVDELPSASGDPESAMDREQAVRAAVSRFLDLVPVQRSCVVLKDVLGHSLEEIAALVALSVPAVKAALHRGRARLRELGASSPPEAPAPGPTPAVVRYAALFNARDWDGVRAMLTDDVKLDLVARARREGRRQVSEYFTNYDAVTDWHLRPGWLDGQEVLLVSTTAAAPRPRYFIQLTVRDQQIAAIRDFRYIPYIAREATYTFAPVPSPPPRGRGLRRGE
jgi:RNA polymerase sigma factor (sigma-70 family)